MIRLLGRRSSSSSSTTRKNTLCLRQKMIWRGRLQFCSLNIEALMKAFEQYTKADLRERVLRLYDEATLITAKHDPNQMASKAYNGMRSVLSWKMMNPECFHAFMNGEFRLQRYRSERHQGVSYFVTPTENSTTMDLASGIEANSLSPSWPIDGLLFYQDNQGRLKCSGRTGMEMSREDCLDEVL